jgi:hypothetical protein
MYPDSAVPLRVTRTPGLVDEDVPLWEDVHGDIRRWSDPAVRAMLDLAECGPLPASAHVL